MTAKLRDILVSLGIVSIGVFALFQVGEIENVQREAVGPELVPNVVSWLIVIFGVMMAIQSVLFPSRDKNSRPPMTRDGIIVNAILIGIGFFYFFLFLAFGYLVSTVIALAAVLYMFGTRRLSRLVPVSVMGGAVYYLVFIRLMGIYDPPGSIIDMAPLLSF
ncbi:MAG: tripartite tricarboxylate transporter TctB family protein [Rhodospirillales bacterium]|nr:tripartite tricarboxylate transporter TctB family protein [Rhodospirillales bacterium]